MPVCPFCGIATDTPHESQQGCLAALTAEISRLRAILDRSQPAPRPTPASGDEPADPIAGDDFPDLS